MANADRAWIWVRSWMIVESVRVGVGVRHEGNPGASFAGSVQPRPPNSPEPQSLSAPHGFA